MNNWDRELEKVRARLQRRLAERQEGIDPLHARLWSRARLRLDIVAVRALNLVVGLVSLPRLCLRIHHTPRVRFHIDSAPPVISESPVIIDGWCFIPNASNLPSLRVKSISLDGIRSFSNHTHIHRPDVAAAFGGSPFIEQSGFSFNVRLAPSLNYLRLEAQVGFKWVPLMDTVIKRTGKFTSSTQSEAVVIKQGKWPEDRPLVSVVIPCFNYGKYVEEAVDSVLRQTFQNLEIIVVDGGSDDPDTIKRLRSLQKPKTTVHFREGRHLVGDNRNFGIKRAKGKYVCCLDADDMLKETYLEKALFIAEAYDYDLVYPSVQCFGGSNELWQVRDISFVDCMDANGVSTVALFRKEAWEKVGGYMDWGLGEEYVYEDWEFWVRLLGNGFRGKAIPEPLMMYRVHGSGLCSKNTKSYEEHSRIIRETNKSLLSQENLRRLEKKSKGTLAAKPPFINFSTKPANEAPNILCSMACMAIGKVDAVFFQVCRRLKSAGYNLCYATTAPEEPFEGDSTHRYHEITKEIYHLPHFLQQPVLWRDFIFYLLEAKHIHLIIMLGSTFLYDLLPEIKDRFPTIRVVDMFFTEFSHTVNHSRYSGFIDLNISGDNDGYESVKSENIGNGDELMMPYLEAIHRLLRSSAR